MSSYIDRLAKASRDELDAPVKRAVKTAISRVQRVDVEVAERNSNWPQPTAVVVRKLKTHVVGAEGVGVYVKVHDPRIVATIITDPTIRLAPGVRIRKAKDRSGMYQPAAAKGPANSRGPSRKNRGVTR